MRFSIITVCLNAGEDLLRTVESVLEQTYDNYEIVIKDGGSIDGSLSRLPQSKKMKIYCEHDSGIYNAMNQAVQYATGDYYIFMNCGDLFYDKYVLEKIDQYVRKSQDKCIYGLCFNRKLQHTNAYPSKLSRFTCYRTMICHQATVYSRELFDEHIYDESYKILADKEYLLWMVCHKKLEIRGTNFTIVNYKADGVCEDKKYAEQNAADLSRLHVQYFGLIERLWYSVLLSLTFPRLRKYLASNKVISKFYMSILKKMYSLLSR